MPQEHFLPDSCRPDQQVPGPPLTYTLVPETTTTTALLYCNFCSSSGVYDYCLYYCEFFVIIHTLLLLSSAPTHQDKFYVCENLHGNKPISDSDPEISHYTWRHLWKEVWWGQHNRQVDSALDWAVTAYTWPPAGKFVLVLLSLLRMKFVFYKYDVSLKYSNCWKSFTVQLECV